MKGQSKPLITYSEVTIEAAEAAQDILNRLLTLPDWIETQAEAEILRDRYFTELKELHRKVKADLNRWRVGTP